MTFVVPTFRSASGAFAMALGQPIALVVREPEMSLLVLVMIPLIPIMAVPMIAGAYMGTLLSPVRTTTTPAAVIPSAQFPGVTSRLMMLSNGGLLIGAIPVSFVPRTSSALFILWIAVAAVPGVASVAWAGSGVWKATGIAVRVAIAAFMTAVIYDTSMGGPNHNMLPFKLWYSQHCDVRAGGVARGGDALDRWEIACAASGGLTVNVVVPTFKSARAAIVCVVIIAADGPTQRSLDQ